MDLTDLAYAAGLFDGEGYVGIGKHYTPNRPDRTPSYQIQCKVSMADIQAIEFLSVHWGGRTYYSKQRSPKHRPVCQWVLLDKESVVFLKDILPYLKVKKERASIALEFQEHKLATLPRGKFHRIPEPIRIIRESFWQRMRDLNYRGVKVQ